MISKPLTIFISKFNPNASDTINISQPTLLNPICACIRCPSFYNEVVDTEQVPSDGAFSACCLSLDHHSPKTMHMLSYVYRSLDQSAGRNEGRAARRVRQGPPDICRQQPVCIITMAQSHGQLHRSAATTIAAVQQPQPPQQQAGRPCTPTVGYYSSSSSCCQPDKRQWRMAVLRFCCDTQSASEHVQQPPRPCSSSAGSTKRPASCRVAMHG